MEDLKWSARDAVALFMLPFEHEFWDLGAEDLPRSTTNSELLTAVLGTRCIPRVDSGHSQRWAGQDCRLLLRMHCNWTP